MCERYGGVRQAADGLMASEGTFLELSDVPGPIIYNRECLQRTD
jgi:hypothetical protein